MNKWDLMLQEELKKQSVNLHQFVQRCCLGLPLTDQQVIDELLSPDDEQDIINGDVPLEVLRLHIEVWISSGMPFYSGKSLAKKEV